MLNGDRYSVIFALAELYRVQYYPNLVLKIHSSAVNLKMCKIYRYIL